MTFYMPRSAALVYDDIAIAVIKVRHNPDNDAAKAVLMELDSLVQQQAGALLHEQVCASPEYQALLQVNDDIYVRNDLIKTRVPTGEDMAYTDGKVGDRWRAKRALQAKWFPAAALTEQKFGYAAQ